MLFIEPKKNDVVAVCSESEHKGKVGKIVSVNPKKGFRGRAFNQIEVKFEDKTTALFKEWELCTKDDLKQKQPE